MYNVYILFFTLKRYKFLQIFRFLVPNLKTKIVLLSRDDSTKL